MKILCLGHKHSNIHTPEHSVRFVEWENALSVRNLAEFDCLILNMRTIPEGSMFSSTAVDRVFSRSTWTNIVNAKRRVFVIGRAASCERESDWGSPTFFVKNRLGHPYSPLEDVFFFRINEYPFEMSGVKEPNEFAAELLSGLTCIDYSFEIVGIHEDDQEHLIDTEGIGRLPYGTFAGYFVSYRPIEEGAVVCFLPNYSAAKIDPIFSILKVVARITPNSPGPEWVARLQLPGTAALKDRQMKLVAEIEGLKQEVQDLGQQYSSIMEISALLWADGIQLEEVVESGLKEMGAKVYRKGQGRDDWRIEVPGYPLAVCEVKGTHNPGFKKDATRQLAEWVIGARVESDHEVKGVFFGNTSRLDPPSAQRKLQEDLRLALDMKLAMVRTLDLYLFLIAHRLKLASPEQFWSRVFSGSGPIDFSDLLNKIPPEFLPFDRSRY